MEVDFKTFFLSFFSEFDFFYLFIFFFLFFLIQASYDERTRTFRGVINWAPNTFGGDSKWTYKMVFSGLSYILFSSILYYIIIYIMFIVGIK